MNFYKGFDLISKKYIPDCASTGIYLRHRKTGLEVFHLLNDDKENLFAFAFRTPNNKSNGVAHIIEHSVFCGSRKYPLKDPFIVLENQSVQTYMNALTFPDKTVYPASSVLPADYFNLMSVYSDAVFFPRLDKEIFLQEGRHLELDSRGKPCMQGVVFNEMKGAYSSFISAVGDAIDRALVPDTVYAKDSGGDPLEIAQITYEEFLAFHKKYYSPENCLVFLYGNIPTEKQLDFLQENVLDEFESRCAASMRNGKEGLLKSEKALMLASETQKPFTKMVTSCDTGPVTSGVKDSTAILSWLLCNSDDMDNYARSVFLGALLCAHDGSPLSKALLKSGLGKDISEASGTDAGVRQISFSVGLRGVKKQDELKVKDFIFAELKKLCEEGISDDDIESTFNAIDFNNREIKRFQEPFSLTLMRRALRSWNYGGEPAETLFVRNAFDRLKRDIQSDSGYVTKLIETNLLNNRHCVFNIVRPDKNYLADRAKKEKEIVEEAVNELSGSTLSGTEDSAAAPTTSGKKRPSSAPASSCRERISALSDALHQFQQTPDSPEKTALIPHIRPKNLKIYDEKIKIRRKDIHAKDGDIPFFVSRENTNGIAYVTAAFPMDIFPPDMYPYLPFFAYILNEIGWGSVRWDKASTLIAKNCGGFSTISFSSSCPDSPGAKELFKSNKAFAGRQWLFCKIKMLDDRLDASIDIMRDCILGANYDDKKRIKTLAEEALNDLEASVVPNGHIFASSRSECRINKSRAVEEAWGGLTQIFTLRKILSDLDGTIVKMKEIASKIFSGGAVLHLTADDSIMQASLKAVRRFARELSLRAPSSKYKASCAAYYSLTNIEGKNSSENEMIQVPGLIGFAAMTFKASKYGTREHVAEKVLAHILTSGVLWEKIRTVGGAYGAFAEADPVNECFTLCTYRDPNPLASLKAFDECLEEAAATEYGDDFVEKAVTGTFSGEIQPKTPGGRGSTAFLRELYCIDSREKLEKARILLTITALDLHKAALRLLKFRKKQAKCVIITPKLQKNLANFEKLVI